jgi:hypothetical protein
MRKKTTLLNRLVEIIDDQWWHSSNDDLANELMAEFRDACDQNKIKLPDSYLGDLKYKIEDHS